QPSLQPGDRKRREAARDEQLCGDHPAATAAEPSESRGVEAIDERRPEKLERIREPHPRQEADCGERRPLVAQPVAERVAGEEERQAGREAEREHHGDLRLAQRGKDRALSNRGLRRRLTRWYGAHRSRLRCASNVSASTGVMWSMSTLASFSRSRSACSSAGD